MSHIIVHRDMTPQFHARGCAENDLPFTVEQLVLEKQAASELLGIVLTSKVASPWDIEVAEVQAGSPAERGGLKVGDKVAEINGEPAHLGATASTIILKAAPAGSINLSVWRPPSSTDAAQQMMISTKLYNAAAAELKSAAAACLSEEEGEEDATRARTRAGVLSAAAHYNAAAAELKSAAAACLGEGEGEETGEEASEETGEERGEEAGEAELGLKEFIITGHERRTMKDQKDAAAAEIIAAASNYIRRSRAQTPQGEAGVGEAPPTSPPPSPEPCATGPSSSSRSRSSSRSIRSGKASARSAKAKRSPPSKPQSPKQQSPKQAKRSSPEGSARGQCETSAAVKKVEERVYLALALSPK